MGGLGADMVGGFGTELCDDSESEAYEESRFAKSRLASVESK